MRNEFAQFGPSLVGDGDGDVVGEEVAEDKGMKDGGDGEGAHGEGGDAREEDRKRLSEWVRDNHRIFDSCDRESSRWKSIGPPSKREPESNILKKNAFYLYLEYIYIF